MILFKTNGKQIKMRLQPSSLARGLLGLWLCNVLYASSTGLQKEAPILAPWISGLKSSILPTLHFRPLS